MSGTNHLSQYEAPSLRVKTGVYDDGRPIYTFYATPSPAAAVGPVFNVSDYGATGDGVTDDTAAIQAALNAAFSAGGGVVSLPGGVYATSAALVIPGSNVVLRGAGWNTIIQPQAGATYDAVTLPLPPNNTVTGYVAQYVGIGDLMIDCSHMTGTVVGQGNGIHFFGARYSWVDNVYIQNCPNIALCCDANSTDSGYINVFSRIKTANCAMSFYMAHESSTICNSVFEGFNATLAAAQPLFGSMTAANSIYLSSGRHNIYGCRFGGSGTQNQAAIRATNGQSTRIMMNSFDTIANSVLYAPGGNVQFCYNELINPASAGGNPALSLVNGNNVIVGNVIDGGGGTHYTYAVLENAAPNPRNIIADNWFPAGLTGMFSLASGSTTRISGNAGYNPVGHLANQPAVPATTVAYTNTSGVDCMVYVTGGTVTAIAVGGTATGLTAGGFHVPAGSTITLTYSVAPTWQWFGE